MGEKQAADAGGAYLQAWAKPLRGLTAKQIGQLKRVLGRLPEAKAEAETAPEVLAARSELQKARVELVEAEEQWGAEYGCKSPKDYYGVERLAARAGVPIEWLDEGNWVRMWARIEGYLLSVKDGPRNPTAERTTDSKTDNEKKSSAVVPENNDVAKLAREIRRRLPQGDTKIQIARDFTDGDEQRADSLLRQVRRFPKLLK